MTQLSTSGYISEGNENTVPKRYLHSMFIAALFTIAKIWKQLKCPLIEEWIKNMRTIEYYSAKNKFF